MIRTVFVLAALLVLTNTTQGTTYYVPDDWPTIQAAINVCANGDTVIVRAGTYVENIDFVGKAITVVSEQGATVTTIDGNQSGSVVVFRNEEDQSSVLDGFTLTNGSGTPNLFSHYVGGGVYCYETSPIITNNVITGNTVAQFGGGIRCNGQSPTITNNIISENSSDNGGGISCQWCSPIITNNTITGNTAYGTSQYSGGGIFCDTISYPTITNNIISGNKAYGGGGGIGFVHSFPAITNNTITGNSADGRGGGIQCTEHSVATITNTILWDNSALVEGKEIRIAMSSHPSTLTISYSDVDGGQSSISVAPNCTLIWRPGMIDADPLFVDETNGDFHLTYLSPCKDTGNNSAVTELYDFEGDPRIAYGTVDMGADEFYTHLYITGAKTPGGSIQGKFIGLPGTTPVGLFVGSGVLSSPMPTMWGEYWLQAPWILLGPLGSIPSDGVMVLPTTLPPGITVPVDIPMQALIGLNADSYTNLEVLEVR